jgi:glycogen debranching enzyme
MTAKETSAARGVSKTRWEPGATHVHAASSVTDERTRVLKHGDTFALFDHYGDIKPGGLGEEGLYHDGTRFLSSLLLDLEGERPFFLNSTVRAENDQLTVALTNADLERDGRPEVPLGTLLIAIRKFLWHGVLYQEMRVRNLGLESVGGALSLRFAADYADIFEVRGMKRRARGEDLVPEIDPDRVVLSYRGRDGEVRRTVLSFSPRPSVLTGERADLDFSLAPQEESTFFLTIGCERRAFSPLLLPFEEARSEAQADLERYGSWACHVATSNGLVDSWVDRAVADLHMLTTDLPTGPYPYAGVPWFNTPFGRDGIVTALGCLWMRPALARGVLAYLASTQAADIVAAEEAEPGRILHETRKGEMAALGEIPFGRYYGSVDATPLFVVLAGAYYERTGDRTFVEELWPNVQAALDWMDRFGDRDGDGFLEYERKSPDGLRHQGWRDSDDAVFHADGSLAEGPIALCEVQGYAYAAHRAGELLARLLGDEDEAMRRSQRAASLQRSFERAFWCEELSTYGLALDGRKDLCRVRSSSAGQCLFSGIAHPEHARRLARTLFAPESFSGWGLRTIASSERRYSPLSYHDGSVWPHDNALAAKGLAQYGFVDEALSLWEALFDASAHFSLQRMPELFCGFPRQPGEGPILYPVACAPQAWSAASVLLLLQVCIGIEIDAPARRILFTRPRLPASLNEVRIHNLEVAGATMDLAVVRHRTSVDVEVLRRASDVDIVVVK